MATANNTSTNASKPLMVADHYPAVAPVIEREFQRICPTLELLDFNATNVWNWIEFSGSEAEILRLGVIDPSMIAVRPKRRVHIPQVGWTQRRAGGQVEVHLYLGEELNRAHPLAPLAIWNWEAILEKSKTAEEWRKDRKSDVFGTVGCVKGLTTWLHDQNNRFRFADSDTKRMQLIVDRFVVEIIAAIEDVVVVDTQAAPRPSHLRLVVDNTVRP